ncbi:hypothetical protein PFISCL1PPCAC_15968, partial [Pristionchus fissidentatus]
FSSASFSVTSDRLLTGRSSRMDEFEESLHSEDGERSEVTTESGGTSSSTSLLNRLVDIVMRNDVMMDGNGMEEEEEEERESIGDQGRGLIEEGNEIDDQDYQSNDDDTGRDVPSLRSDSEYNAEVAATRNRIREMRDVDQQSDSIALRYSRNCGICHTENLAERAAYTECGHISCVPCVEDHSEEEMVVCRFCDTETRFIRLFEDSRNCGICYAENPRQRAAYKECGHISCLPCAKEHSLSMEEQGKRLVCPFCRRQSRFVRLFEDTL